MTTRTAANTRARRPRTSRKAIAQALEVPQYKVTHGRACVCGSYVIDETDTQDGQEHAYDFELVDSPFLADDADEPCFSLWKHQCPKGQ